MDWSPPINIWERFSFTQEDTGSGAVAALRFLSTQKGEAFTASRSFTIRSNFLAIADHIAAISGGRLTGVYANSILVEGVIDGRPFLACVDMDRSSMSLDDDDAPWGADGTPERPIKIFQDRIASYNVEVVGHRETISAIFAHLDKIFGREHIAQIHWWYRSDNGIQHKRIYLPPVKTELHPEFYPDMDMHPSKFITDYLNAPESILMLAGAPGTGKTTLLRHMIVENRLTAYVCFDEALMGSDKIFQDFLMGAAADIMVIEDADAILTSREHDGNKLMSRFLNISDGLIKLPNKKLVFTTNLTDFQKVDAALLRPGRCYALMLTRALDLKEAQEASKVGGFPTPTERKQYTLADLFNQGKTKAGVRRIGYTG